MNLLRLPLFLLAPAINKSVGILSATFHTFPAQSLERIRCPSLFFSWPRRSNILGNIGNIENFPRKNMSRSTAQSNQFREILRILYQLALFAICQLARLFENLEKVVVDVEPR